MGNNKINNKFILLVEDVILGKDITLSEYNFLRGYVENVIKQRGYSGIVKPSEITNEMLLRLKSKASTYRFTDNIGGRKRYIYYYILYCIDETLSLSYYGVDIPDWMLRDVNIDNNTLCVSIDSIEELQDKDNYQDKLNDEMENAFLLELLISDITEQEKDIIVKHYFKGITQQEIANEYGVTQQRIGNILKDLKVKYKGYKN